MLSVTLFLPGGPDRLSDWIPAGLFLFVISFAAATVLLGLWQILRWLSCWRNWMRLLLGGLGFMALVALFYAEEDWRGWRAWQELQKKEEAKGERFSLASLIPGPVPDEQNFALTPIAFTSYGHIMTREGKILPAGQRDPHFMARMRISVTPDYPGPTNCAGDWARGTFTRLEGWQEHYRALAARTNEYPVPASPQSPAADVLLALSRYDGVIEELQVASRLPASRFPVAYDCAPPWNIALPHLAALKGCARVLQLRSVAELQNTQSGQALEDVRLMLQLADKVRTEPLLISHLVRQAMVQLALQPVWEGLAKHQWSEPQLSALDAELAKLDFPADWVLSARGELAVETDCMRFLRRHPSRLRELRDLRDLDGRPIGSLLPSDSVVWLIPAGWFYQNQCRLAGEIEDSLLPLADTGRGAFFPETARRAERALAAETPGPYNLGARLVLPMMWNAARRFAYGQAAVNLARTAMALERWRLVLGELPESLAPLAPQFIAKLPPDPVGGLPLKYRREAAGRFVLYSVGWDEADNGGVTSLKGDGTVDLEKGDWVWRYPSATRE
jgi:hypothetical protein